MPSSSLFISSMQKELAEERRAVKAFVEGDPLMRRYFTAFLFGGDVLLFRERVSAHMLEALRAENSTQDLSSFKMYQWFDMLTLS